MIFDIAGKKLVFGMEWPALVDPGTYRVVAANKAFAMKSPLLWHMPNAAYAGYVPARAFSSAPSGELYAAAQALSRVPNLPQNALFVARMPDKNFAVIGIFGGRPANRFDRVGLSAEGLPGLVKDFGSKCADEGFALVGDPDAPVQHTVTPLSLEEIARNATAECALRPPSRAAMYKKKLALVGAVALFCCAAWFLKDDLFPKNKQQEKTATELYRDALVAHANDPVVAARDYKGWYEWYRTSLRRSYGGWGLTNVKCDFRAPGSTGSAYMSWSGVPLCSVEFARENKDFATVATFFSAVPKEWASVSVYNAQEDRMTTTLHATGIRTTKLDAVLQLAGSKRDRDVDFVSRMQKVQRLVMAPPLPESVPFLLPTGIVGTVEGKVFRATHWAIKDGASNFVKLLDDFPAYATLSKAELTYNPRATSEMPYRVTLEGELFTSN